MEQSDLFHKRRPQRRAARCASDDRRSQVARMISLTQYLKDRVLQMTATDTPPEILTPDELAAIRSVASVEFMLIYDAMRFCGVRVGDAVELDIRHWDRDRGRL